jgi:VCBS repeat-containing protein
LKPTHTFRRLATSHPVFGALVVLAVMAVPGFAFAAFGGDAGASSAPTCLGLEATIVGTSGADHIRGTRGNDVIDGLGGNDRIIGGGGNDVICGGPGDDVITSGSGPDQISGGPGNDRIFSRRGPDVDYGMEGDDLVVGGPGIDRCSGGSGMNRLRECERHAPPPGGGGSEGCGGKKHESERCHPNSAPVAAPDSATTNEDTAKAIDVLANDTDPDGDALTITGVNTTGTRGAVSITGGGSGVSFDPRGRFDQLQPGQSAEDHFTYTISDGHEHTATATVTVTVTGVDDPPVAVADKVELMENDPSTHVDVLANDTDVDGGPKLVESVTSPVHGTATISAEGKGVDYRPEANYCGPDTFTYTLNGGSTATVSVEIECFDEPPVAVDDTATVVEDSGANAIDVLANDTDTDGGPKLVESVTQPANGTVVITGGGTGLTYAPGPNYCNETPGTTPDTFTYTLNPGSALTGSTATVSIKVTCVDDPPVAVNDTTTVVEDSGTTAIDVLANDTDVDGGPKQIESVTQPANGTAVITGGGTELTYTPSANYCNEPPGTSPDTFTYTLNGGSTATVSVKVTCVDDPPVAVNDTKTVQEDSGATAIDVLANDTDIDGGPKQVESVTQPANGTVVITGGGTGLTYDPSANYCNEPPGTTPDTFTYTLNGGSTATVSVIVDCVDDPPVAVNDTKTVEEDSGATAIDVLANDTDIDGGPKQVESVTQPANGTVVITGGGTGLTYSPSANYCNEPPGTTPDTFTYTLNGGSTATVSVIVDCVDDPPVAVNDTKTVEEDSGATAVDVLANDTDIDGGPKQVESVTQPANGTVVITGGGTGLTYDPSANYCNEPPGTTPDTFTYTLNGGSTATVSVTVVCVDDPPVAVNDTASVEEGASATAIDVLANDTDIDGGPKQVESVTQPANGTVVITGGGTGLTYEPNANYCNQPPGTTPDTFTYSLNGGSTATVSVTVICSDLPPTDISLSSSSLKENEPAGTEVGTFSTTDPDVGDTFTYGLVAGEGSTDNGSFEISGNVLKTKESFNFEAKSSYSIRVRTTDSGGKSFEKKFTITIVNADDPPADLTLSNAEIDENEPAGTQVGTFSTTDEDVGDTFTYGLVAGEGSTDNGSFEISGNMLKAKESFNFEAKSSYSIRVRTTDSGGKSFEKKFTVTIINVNDPPVVVNDTYTGAVGNTKAVLGNVVSGPSVALSGESPLANDSDEDAGQTISVVPETISTADGGSVTIGANGDFTYTPGVGDKNENDSFNYKVTDGEATTTGKVTIAIENTLVWYVNGSAASEGNGTSASPFKTLGGVDGAGGSGDADGPGDYLFLYGLNTYSGGLPLEANEKLVGQPEGLSVPNHPNLVAAGGTNPVVTNSGGDAIALANGAEVLRVNATGASGVGVRGTGVTSATVGPNTTISGNTGGGVALSGAAGGEIAIGSTIENETGAVVSVANRNSGTVTLSGSITSSNGGVSASSNTGAHVAFTGALNLIRSGGEGFVATGGGGIKATAAGNKVSTTNGTAVRVVGTTIDSGGVDFQAVSASGATDGVVLENTGSTAGLTVSGTGSAASGGTITSSTGPGVLLSNTSNVSLASLNVTNGGDDGIRGTNVSGFSLAGSSQVTGNGNAVGEDGLDFTNLTGTVNLTGDTVSASADRNFAVVNESGTVAATVSGGTYSNTNNSAVGSDAIFFEGTNTGTIGLTVENATFTNNRDDQVQVTTDASNTVTENVTVKGNTMSNTVGQLGGSVTLNPGGNATMQASVLNNRITGANVEGITVDTPGSLSSPQPAQVGVTISGNTIGNTAVNKSGASTGNDIGVRSNGGATVKALVTENNLSEYTNTSGLELVQNDGTGALDATVRGNTITKPATVGETEPLQFGMRVIIGSDVGDTGTSCLDIGGAGELKNNLTGAAAVGSPDLRFSMNGEATAQLAGYGGGAHETMAVKSYLAGRNTAPDGVIASQFVETPETKSRYATTASCPLP